MINVSTLQVNISDTFGNRQVELVAMISIFTVAFVIGTFLSLILTVTIAFRPRLHTGSGILIAHHQFLHVLQTGISNPLYMFTGWIVWLGLSVSGMNCFVMHFFCKLFTFTEMWASLMLAVNRFVALIFPHHYNAISSNKAITVLMLIPWLIGLALTVPGLYGIGTLFGNRQVDCGYITVTSHAVATLVIVMGVYLPLAIQGLLYAVVLIVHYRQTKIHEVSTVQKKRFLLFRLLFGSYLWYVVCYAPQPIALYGFPQFWFEDKLRAGWFQLLQEVGYAGSPVFLLLMNKDIMHDTKEGCSRLCHARSNSSVMPSKMMVSSNMALSRRKS
ncbi:rhodopsin-like [Paramacrobiotus metropolitanus]|uniref:rhodopsin-like n=1 Tax=Paramacrobiotus metropolitanus TaxID=2943436 RepID=UPI00244625CB|nr:rhodopsin-like [Paramacrobiotus metropolitanus]